MADFQHHVECSISPSLDSLPAELRGRVRHELVSNSLHVEGHLSRDELRDLRNCDASNAAWQVVVDKLAIQIKVSLASASGAFPSTMWGLLLAELGTQEEEHWRRFMELYRRPISGIIRRILTMKGSRKHHTGAQFDDLVRDAADDFFNWFFMEQKYKNLRRVSDTGEVYRFRGYLARCIQNYLLRDSRRKPEYDIDDFDPGRDQDEFDRITDEEFCRAAFEGEMEIIRRDRLSMWKDLMCDMLGHTLEKVANVKGCSVSKCHYDRDRARKLLRERLLVYRIRNMVTAEEEAELEFEKLAPVFMKVGAEYAEQHKSGWETEEA